MAQVLEPPPNGSPSGASWQLRALPGTNVLHAHSGEGCVLSEIRFAVFGGTDVSGSIGTSCKVLCLDTDITRWDALPPLHEPWSWFKCAHSLLRTARSPRHVMQTRSSLESKPDLPPLGGVTRGTRVSRINSRGGAEPLRDTESARQPAVPRFAKFA